jgi:hypothetical protein
VGCVAFVATLFGFSDCDGCDISVRQILGVAAGVGVIAAGWFTWFTWLRHR